VCLATSTACHLCGTCCCFNSVVIFVFEGAEPNTEPGLKHCKIVLDLMKLEKINLLCVELLCGCNNSLVLELQ
jgi:hypothetical protein